MLLLLLAAAQAVVPPSLAATPPVAPENKIECRFDDEVTSRIRTKKVCLRQSEWEVIAKEAQRDIESSRNDRGVAPN